jgi:RHS repeat-associated protein
MMDIASKVTSAVVYMNRSLGSTYHPDLVVSITNPFAGQTDIAYESLAAPSGESVYARDPDPIPPDTMYPVMNIQYPIYVVSALSIADGLGTVYDHSYTYGGAKAHLLGRGLLGFRWMEEIDSSANAKTRTFYNQDFPLTGLPSDIEKDRASDGARFRDTVHDYWNEISYPPLPPAVAPVKFVAPKQVLIHEYDGSPTQSRTIERDFNYDSFILGNLTSTFHYGDISGNGDEREETTAWVQISDWFFREGTLRLKDGSGGVLREKQLTYNSAGLAVREEINAGGGLGDPNNPVFTYEYDSFGNQTRVTDPRGCPVDTHYESTYQTYPETVTNCLSHQTGYTWDGSFGVMRTRTEPHRPSDSPVPTTTFDYDNFGRRTQETNALDALYGSAYGTTKFIYADWGNPAAQRVITYQTEDYGTGNVLWSEQYFDGLGRIYAVRREGPDFSTSGKSILSNRSFDSRNLITAQAFPYFVDQNLQPLETPQYNIFTYDVLGRGVQADHPDSTHSYTIYERGVVTFIDERNKQKKKYFDGLEQLVKVQEFNGTDIYNTIYERDAAGSLITVTNALGHITRISYDMVGRKRAMCDPNMGTRWDVAACDYNSPPLGAWLYTYNKAGDLKIQQDANYQTNNQLLCFDYDLLGRPTVKKNGTSCSTGTTTLTEWTYDDTAVMFSTGRVTRVRDLPDTTNTITNFTYDALGRVTQSQRVLLGQTYNMGQSYDSLGRIRNETSPQPDNETVIYNYNEAGWLKSVDNYVNEILYNARGQKKSITYANNLTSTFTYNDPVDRPGVPPDFRLYNRSTSNNQQDLTYGYDQVGNVLSITDGWFTGTRNFTYDDLNRLSTAYGPFGSGQSQKDCTGTNGYTYDAIGNIRSKCGIILAYDYTMHPSAVSAISGSLNKTYDYDKNGNMIRRDTQTLTWNIENRVTSVSLGGVTTSMEYDYTGQRIRKDAPGGTTVYPFKGYEIDLSGVITKFIKSGNEILASRVRQTDGTTTRHFYHNDHLGGVNVITDSNGRCQLNEYDPWGGVSRSEGPTPGSQPTCDPTHRFTGQELDPETGLYYYGGRYYDQEISRFISPDIYVQEPGDPQFLNRYTYALNNPVFFKDPSGHLIEAIIVGAIIGATVGAISAAITGGNIWQGMLTGAVAGGTFGGIGQFVGVSIAQAGVPGGIGPPTEGWALAGKIGGSIAGGMSAGAVAAAINGGNVVQSMLTGGITAGLAAAINLPKIAPFDNETVLGSTANRLINTSLSGAFLGGTFAAATGGDIGPGYWNGRVDVGWWRSRDLADRPCDRLRRLRLQTAHIQRWRVYLRRQSLWRAHNDRERSVGVVRRNDRSGICP